MEVSGFQASAANISRVSSDGKGEEPDGRERERALVARAKEGDRDAFGALYREHVAAVSRLVRFYAGCALRAADLLHAASRRSREFVDVVAGAGAGAAIGAIAGGGKGAAIGTVAGGAAGTNATSLPPKEP